MPHITLLCTSCNNTHTADIETLCCATCSSPLDVQYTVQKLGSSRADSSRDEVPLPIHEIKTVVSLGEGNTPCVNLPSLQKVLGLQHLYAKLEFCNPTGSFKDRGTAIMMSMIQEHKATEIVEDSSGNAGASIAAYSARAGINAHIFVPDNAPPAKLHQIKIYGAQIHLVDGSREDVTQAAITYCTKRDLIYASHTLSPYFLEGLKSFAYEATREIRIRHIDHVVMPVGNGSLFVGAWKGFEEFAFASPQFHCIQSEAFMPITAAYNNHDWTPEPGAGTVAGGISVASPPRKQQILKVVQASNGTALAVNDEETIRWQKLLATEEGLFVESTSATAFAGLEKLVRSGIVQSTDIVLVPLTGNGLKDSSLH